MTTTAASDASYRILMREGCRIVYGHMPLPEFLALLGQAGDHEVLHAGTARVLDATAVIGPPAALARLRRRETAAAVDRVRARLGRAALRLDPEALRWLAAGEHGPASLALFVLLTGVRPRHYRGAVRADLPRDANAFRRCRLLLEQVPSLRQALGVLAQRVHETGVAEWAAIAEAWDDICAHMDYEVPDWRQGRVKAPGVAAVLACFRELEAA